MGTFLIFVLATIQIILFGWVFGIERGWEEMHKGAAIRVPSFFKVIFKYVCPTFLLLIFTMWVLKNVFGFDFAKGSGDVSGYVKALFVQPSLVSWLSVSLVIGVGIALAAIISTSAAYRTPHDQRNPNDD